MSKENILVVDDEKDIVELLQYNLEKEGYRVSAVFSGEQCLENVKTELPDLILLDLMLPEIDGLDVCKILKSNSRTSNIPIIMLTAKGEETDIVLGLELGADDYITKPFKIRELLARVKAVLRRAKNNISLLSKEKDLIKFKDLVIDSIKHQVTLKNQPLNLTSTEFKLLKFLASHPGKVFTREQLLNQVWSEDSFIVDRAVDVHIRRLRQKLLTASNYIITIRGVGYRFKEEV
ncbi:MAG TPA: DNA-binding response regulator [Candidatus Atribacteria bacterium]|nr:DNA-binding response regulator [Candidatus Atribacteria bacterium]